MVDVSKGFQKNGKLGSDISILLKIAIDVDFQALVMQSFSYHSP